jgi:hypothetical protein
MVSAGVCWKGKTKIHFIDTENNEFNVNSINYMKLLDDGLLPGCRNLFLCGRLHVHFSAGWSKITQEHLNEEVPEFMKKGEWPS